jgi:hypothetical protein
MAPLQFARSTDFAGDEPGKNGFPQRFVAAIIE